MDSQLYENILENNLIPFLHELPALETRADSKSLETTPLASRKKWNFEKRTYKRGRWIFQQDNDPKHSAKRIKLVLDEMKVDKSVQLQVLDWPSQSPDLNPIENLWRVLKINVRKRTKLRKPSNFDELFEITNEEWKKIEPDLLKKLIETMPERCNEVIRNHGRHIHF